MSSKETVAAKYLKLNEEFETKYNAWFNNMMDKYEASLKSVKEKHNQKIEDDIKRELNAMETALKVGALSEAAIYKMKTEILFKMLFP